MPEQIAQKSCGFSILRIIQSLTGHDPVQPALTDPVLSRVFCYVTSRGAFQPQQICDSVTHLLKGENTYEIHKKCWTTEL